MELYLFNGEKTVKKKMRQFKLKIKFVHAFEI